MRIICLFFLIHLSLISSAFADSEHINMKMVTEKTYGCSNGGSIKFLPTRYGNVWKVVFSKEGSLNQSGVVRFYNQTEHFKGDVTTWITVPDSREESPQTGRTSFYMEIKPISGGLELTLESARNSSNKFVCRNF